MSVAGVLCVLVVVLAVVAAAKRNDSPIIGVFTQPSTSTEGNCHGNCLDLAASYVKYLQSAGARVVPINYYATSAQLDKVFASINGLLFPGGGATFPKSAQYMFDKAVAANDKSDFFPVWGTCMGFQWLLISAARDTSVLDPPSGQLDAYNLSIPLDFTSDAPTSRMFQNSGAIYDVLAKENVTMNNHHYGIFPEHFQKVTALSSFYKVLSTNVDRKGVAFVSSMEAFNYPIYGTQWHPEKNNFEYGKTDGIPNEAIDHSPDAVAVSQYTATFFVNEARNNFHQFASPAEEDAALIENYPPSKTTGSFMQTYFFANDF